MTNTERQNQINDHHARAMRFQRPLTTWEMDEIDRLSAEMRAESLAWMNERSPIPAGSTNALEG